MTRRSCTETAWGREKFAKCSPPCLPSMDLSFMLQRSGGVPGQSALRRIEPELFVLSSRAESQEPSWAAAVWWIVKGRMGGEPL